MAFSIDMPKGGPGIKKSEEHKAKIRAWWTEKRRAEHVAFITGRTHSEETKRKIGDAQRDIPRSGTRSVGMKGKKHSTATKLRISEALKGNRYCVGFKHTAETKAKVSLAGKGRVCTEETRVRMRASFTSERRAQLSALAKERGGWRKANRAQRTSIELLVEKLLVVMGVVFRPEYILPEYSYVQWDFALIEKRLLLEVDGCYWHGCRACGFLNDISTTRDRRKNSLARKYGWELLWIPEHEIRRSLSSVRTRIEFACST